MSENAAERALRLLDLVPFVVNNQGITISELASRFSVTREEIVKDLNLLFLCGLPGYTPLELIDLSLEDDVVVIRDPQNLSLPRNFNYSESIVLRIALAALQEIILKSDPRYVTLSNLIRKLEDTYSAEIPSEAFHIEIEKDKIALEIARQALDQGLDLNIKYLNKTKDEVTERRISPQRIRANENKIQLDGYCHLSNDSRTFNLNQILEIRLLPKSKIPEPAHASEGFGSEVELEINNQDSQFFIENEAALVKQSDNKFVMKLHNPQWLIRHAMSNKDIKIISPIALKESLLSGAEAALTRYRDSN
ncbi:MAG: WYL domain-containing protein [Candidatus Nanopelagicaceae bacterium]|nr:WYL domain-containing protein [Candidatus Nanopelagicaceae bacterium]